MKKILFFIVGLIFSVFMSSYKYNYEPELELRSPYRGNTNCPLKTYGILPYADFFIDTYYIYKDSVEYCLGVKNDTIICIKCHQPNVEIGGFFVQDTIPNSILEKENIITGGIIRSHAYRGPAMHYLKLDSGWYAGFSPENNRIIVFIKYWKDKKYAPQNSDTIYNNYIYNYDYPIEINEKYHGCITNVYSYPDDQLFDSLSLQRVYKDGELYELGIDNDGYIAVIAVSTRPYNITLPKDSTTITTTRIKSGDCNIYIKLNDGFWGKVNTRSIDTIYNYGHKYKVRGWD